MYNSKNEEIARRCFASLVLDFEDGACGVLPPVVVCRVLIDGYYCDIVRAETREEAIKIFESTNWSLLA